MKILQDAVDYTRDIISHKIKTMEAKFHHEPQEKMNYFCEDKKGATIVGSSLEHLSNWYLWQFLNNYFKNGEISTANLAVSTHYGVLSNKWKYQLGLIYEPYDSALQFKTSIAHLGQLIIMGFETEATDYMLILEAMLNGKQSKSFTTYPSHPWFLFDLVLRYEGKKMKTTGAYPTRMPSLYKKILENWNTTDNQLIDELIGKICDFHIKQSDEYAQKKKLEDDGDLDPNDDMHDYLEFDSSPYFIFPVEILTWLKIRKNRGLYIGDYSHPLLQLKLNNLDNLVSNYIPQDEIVTKCVNKLARDFPNVKFSIAQC